MYIQVGIISPLMMMSW